MGDETTRDTTMSSNDILLPAEQQSVPFYGHELLAVRLPDGRVCAVLRWQSDIAVWRQGVEAWRDETESRLESVEEVTRLVPELLDRLGPATLSPEHQATVRASVKRLHDLTGASFGGVYADLCDTFHTAKYSDIPESQWREVATWFSSRIAAAERR